MITTRALRYQYPQGPLLQFPDLCIAQGTVLLLSGPSGCGKSTWLALVAALVAPTAGEVVVGGKDLSTLSKAAADAWRAKTIGFLPQKLHLSAALSVHDNLAMAQWAAGVTQDDAGIRQTLSALGVLDLSRRKPGQLSGGQAQRVALARAVLMNPQVVLADEPTASLDDASAADAVALLHSTCVRQGATLVIATHDARVAALIPRKIEGQIGFQPLQLLREQL